MRRLGKTILWFGQQILTAVITAAVLILVGPTVLANLSDSYPSCVKPSGMTRIALSLPEDTVTGAQAPPPPGDYPKDLYSAVKPFDSNLNTVWAIPRQNVQTGQNNSLTVKLHKPTDVEMVCAINGAPVDPNSYSRADRVHEVSVKFTCDGASNERQVYLQSMSAESMQMSQLIGTRCTAMTAVTLTVTSVYQGWDVLELGTDKTQTATEKVALSDITLYGWGEDLTRGQRFVKFIEPLLGG